MFPLLVALADQTWKPTTHYVDPKKLPKPYANRSTLKPPKVHWPDSDDYLRVPPGFKIQPFAGNLKSPRWMLVLPNGDVLVTETYQNRVLLLRDSDGDGKAESRSVFLKGLNWPFGLALSGNYVYVANTDSVVRAPYQVGDLTAGKAETVVSGIPSRGYRQHWTRNILFEPDGKHFFLSIGSETNKTAEPDPRAMIWRYSADGKTKEKWATGLRNPVGLAFRPGTSELWSTVVERDYMGDDLVPDYLTSIKRGDFFGWPWFYLGNHRDPRLSAPKGVKAGKMPEVLFTAHSTPLGLAFCPKGMFPDECEGDLFVATRGSTNRRQLSGYEVVRIRFENGKPNARYETFVTGWCPDRSKAEVYGRPVGVVFWRDGSMLVTDEPGNRIWRVTWAG